MKRFYCEVCKKVKRVRKLPKDISENLNENSKLPSKIGVCDKHEIAYEKHLMRGNR